jgi:recombinational DNA repair protein (RecF pathway)
MFVDYNKHIRDRNTTESNNKNVLNWYFLFQMLHEFGWNDNLLTHFLLSHLHYGLSRDGKHPS